MQPGRGPPPGAAAADGGWGGSSSSNGGRGGGRPRFFRAPPASVVAAASSAPSSNYVPGVGRGATGFTTRAEAPSLLRSPADTSSSSSSSSASSSRSTTASSAADRGPATGAGGGRRSTLLPGVPNSVRTAAEMFGRPPPGYIPGRGRGATGFAGGVSRDDNAAENLHADKSDLSDANFDPFTGYAESLFNDAEYDEEDREADRVYDSIDLRMDARRRSRREMRLKEEIAKLRAEKPTIHQQFADLKRSLATVTKEEWEGIPAVGDYTLKRKQKKAQWLTPAPDSLLLAGRMQQTSYSQTVGGAGAATPIGFGMQTPLLGGGLTTPLGLQTPLGLRTPLLLDAAGGRGRAGGGAGGAGGGGGAGGAGGSSTSLNDLGEARGTVLSVKLDKVIDNLSGQTVIDPKGYLTDLNQMQLQSAADVADIKKARTLLKSVITTNPGHAPGWIAAARLEELAGKLQAARELMASGCQHCPKSEDVWLEAARLEKPRAAKAVLAKAVTLLPHSVRLWLDAYRREKELGDRRRVLRKALEFIPNSVRLWKEAVSLEDERDARLLLTRAVECVPQSVEIWLALARLSSYEEAQKVLNEARKQCPTSPEIWVAACKLEETQGNKKMVDIIICRGRDNLLARGVAKSRDVWLRLAEDAEASGFPLTCAAIVRATMKVGLETTSSSMQQQHLKSGAAAAALGGGGAGGRLGGAGGSAAGAGGAGGGGGAAAAAGGEGGGGQGQRVQMISSSLLKRVWREQAEECLSRGSVGTARALYTCALEKLREKKSLWLALAELESRYGTPQALLRVLQRAVSCCPHAEVLWLMYAKQVWLQGDVQAARKVLAEAFQHNENNESISLAAVKLERENKEYARARKLLRRTRLHVDTPKVWLQSVQLERQLGEYDAAIALCAEARQRHPTYEKLWMVGGQLHLEHHTKPDAEAAAAVYRAGTRVCPRSVPLWLCAVECQCLQQRYTQARAVLEKARLLNPKQPELWRAAIQIELQAGNPQIALHVASKAVQECPTSGLVWAEAIFLEEKSAQPHKAVDALTRCENDVHVVLAVAKIFWRDGKTAKARKWLNRSVTLEPLFGDAWASLLAFELQQDQQQMQEKEKNCRNVINRAAHAMPNKGQTWNKVVKHVSNWSLSFPEKLRKVVEVMYPGVIENSKIPPVIRDALNGKLELSKDAATAKQPQQAGEGNAAVVAVSGGSAAGAAAATAAGAAHIKTEEEKDIAPAQRIQTGDAGDTAEESSTNSSSSLSSSSSSSKTEAAAESVPSSSDPTPHPGSSSGREEKGTDSSSSNQSVDTAAGETQTQATSSRHTSPLTVKLEQPEDAEASSAFQGMKPRPCHSSNNTSGSSSPSDLSGGSGKRPGRHEEKETTSAELQQDEKDSPLIKRQRIQEESADSCSRETR